MTTAERVPVKPHHRQVFGERTPEQAEPESAWVKDFITRLTGVLRSIGGKK
jgi:hypothetical protein